MQLRTLIAAVVLCGASNAAIAQTPTATIVRAANAFLVTLDPKQKAAATFAFDDEKQRARWSNFPTAIFKRAGLKLGDLSASQRAAAMSLVSSALSARGYEKVQQIVEADEALKVSERNNLMFGKDEYYVAILGTPQTRHHGCSSSAVIISG